MTSAPPQPPTADPLQHPWLDGRFAPVSTLQAGERIWTFLAGHCAAGDTDAVARDWSYLPPAGQTGGLEILLQTCLFAGFPRTINALAAVRTRGVAVAVDAHEAAADTWPNDGAGLCRRIYGRTYDKLRRRITELHPLLDRWMVHTGYGRVLSRPGATPRQRELCVIAVLSGQDVAPQLHSHLVGALNVGATAAECRAVLDQTKAVWGPEAQRQVDSLWQRLALRQ